MMSEGCAIAALAQTARAAAAAASGRRACRCPRSAAARPASWRHPSRPAHSRRRPRACACSDQRAVTRAPVGQRVRPSDRRAGHRVARHGRRRHSPCKPRPARHLQVHGRDQAAGLHVVDPRGPGREAKRKVALTTSGCAGLVEHASRARSAGRTAPGRRALGGSPCAAGSPGRSAEGAAPRLAAAPPRSPGSAKAPSITRPSPPSPSAGLATSSRPAGSATGSAARPRPPPPSRDAAGRRRAQRAWKRLVGQGAVGRPAQRIDPLVQRRVLEPADVGVQGGRRLDAEQGDVPRIGEARAGRSRRPARARRRPGRTPSAPCAPAKGSRPGSPGPPAASSAALQWTPRSARGRAVVVGQEPAAHRRDHARIDRRRPSSGEYSRSYPIGPD